MRRYLSEEALPSLAPIEGVDFAAYAAQVVERFANPENRRHLGPNPSLRQ